MRRFLTLFILILLVSNNIKAQADVNILFLGNSYTAVNNLPQLVAKIAESDGKNVYYQSSTPGGHLLLQHAENTASLNLIREGGWDYVVLQEQSQLPTIEYYRSYMEKGWQMLRDTTMKYNDNAQMIGYMTWGRRYGGQQCENFGEGIYCSVNFVDFNHMQDTLASAYNSCANKYESMIAPVGLAWKYVLGDSDMVLHSGDNSHPSIYGSYLAACVFYTLIFEKSPEGLWFPDEIGEKDATYLQKAAYIVSGNHTSVEETSEASVYQMFIKDGMLNIVNSKDNKVSAKVYDVSGNEVAFSDFKGGDCVIDINGTRGVIIVKITDKDTGVTEVRKLIK
ncbi:MAG: T9SS type A sorting domain-containing protein [Candidatus Limimorpha sp.]